MSGPRMTLNECAVEMRDRGIPCVPTRLGDDIEAGVVTFGRMRNRTGSRRTFEIWRVDFERWLDEKAGEKA